MATQRPSLPIPEGDFARLLLAEREVAPRAEVIAQQAAVVLEGCAVNVYLYNEDQSPAWQVKARVGEASVTHAYEAATLARLAETREPLLSSGSSLAREHYAHLDVRRTIAWPTCPSCWTSVLIGAIEAISFDRVLETPEREIGRSGERESLLQGGGWSKFVPWLPGFPWSETYFRLPIVD